jgi:hypothetical protein
MKPLKSVLATICIAVTALPEEGRSNSLLFSSGDYAFRIVSSRIEPRGDKQKITLVVKYENLGGGTYRLRVTTDVPSRSSGGFEVSARRGEIALEFLASHQEPFCFVALHRAGIVVEDSPVEYRKVYFPLRPGPFRK